MKRRPTLRLSPTNEVGKKHAPGFETAAISRPEDTRQDPAEEKPSPPPNPEDIQRNAVAESPTWPTVKQLTKIFLVVAASALSLYLLKRRFF